MRSLLCFGDSLTWGADPDGVHRHAIEDRWPGALREELDRQGALMDLTILADGLPGRTTAFQGNPSAAELNGAAILPTALCTHAPLDAVAIMLGTNDLWCDIAPLRVVKGVRRLVDIVRTTPRRNPAAPEPKVLVIAPPPMVVGEVDSPTETQIAASQTLAGLIAPLAMDLGCGFADASDFASASPFDGVHLDAANTRALGIGLAGAVKALFD